MDRIKYNDLSPLGKVAAWMALIIVAVALALLIQRTVANPSPAGTPPHGAEVKNTAYVTKMSQERKHLLRRMVVAYRHGHMQRFHRLRNRWGKAALPFSNHHHRLCKYCAHPQGKSGCATAGLEVTSNAQVIGARLFTTTMHQRYCWNHGKVNVHPATMSGDTSGFAEAFGWADKGSQTNVNQYEHHHRKHYTNKGEVYEQCLPVPTGCAFPRDNQVYLNMVTVANGTWHT